MSVFKVFGALLVAGNLIAGCVGPVRHEMTPDFPAAVIYPLGAPPVVDGRPRFREIFCGLLASDPERREVAGECEHFLPKLSDEPPLGSLPRPAGNQAMRFQVLIVPGFLNECFTAAARPFGDAVGFLRRQGLAIDEVAVGDRLGSDASAAAIAEAVGSLDLERDEKLILLGHSKGAADILHFLVNYPRLAGRVDAVVSVAGAINGSRLGGMLPDVYNDIARYLLPHPCDAGDDGAVDSLKPAAGLTWLAAHPLPTSVRCFSVAAIAERENLSPPLKKGYDALWLYSPRNDGILLAADQLIPGGTLLGYARADHLSVVLPIQHSTGMGGNANNPPENYPRKVMLEAVLLYLAEALAENGE